MALPFASDLSLQVFQRRACVGELGAPVLNDQNRRLYGLPSQLVQREAFAADREAVPDSYQGERWPNEITPTWHVHGRKR